MDFIWYIKAEIWEFGVILDTMHMASQDSQQTFFL